ncbi:DUF3187 family protein [bacterium]|nr:DUF3187 family protein [bacterium]
MQRRGAGAVGIALAMFLASASSSSAAEFDFTPPVPTRNFAPLQLIFLNPPFERAATLPPGDFALLVSTAESNIIATSQGSIDATLKFEQNTTNFGARYGLCEDWELGLDLPFISRYGGFMDPMINWVEDLFGAQNPERSLFPDNTFGGYEVYRGDTVLFHGDEVTFQPGDLVMSVKHQFHLPRQWPRLAVRGAIKAPTGNPDQALGSGKPDFGIGGAADYSPWSRLMFYANLNLVYPVGPITAGDLTLNPIFTESFAAHLALSQRWSVMLHQATYTSPYHGTGASLLDGTVVELGFGIGFAWSERFNAQLLGIQNMSGVEQSADFTLMLAMQWRPWAIPTDLPPLAPLPPPPTLPPVGPRSP